MPKYKPIIKINKDDKDSYRVLSNLAKNKEYLIKDKNKYDRGLFIKIGHSTKNITGDYPVIWHGVNYAKDTGKRLIKLPPGVEIEEKHGNDMIFFKFKRRRVI